MDLGEAIVQVNGLRKQYGDIEAVKGVSFKVEKGSAFGLLGPNGAGKTTTLEIMEGLRKADGGEVVVAGVDVIKDRTGAIPLIGIQLQSTDNFFEGLKLGEILGLYGRLYNRRVDAIALLDRVGLADRAKAYFKKLSGGQKQRFSIAMGLVNDPLVLFLDEPSTGLDPTARRELWRLIKSIQEDGKTVILTTHYMEEAEELCDTVGIMDHGEIIAMGSPGELIEKFLASGAKPNREVRLATLEDVFVDLTGRELH